MVIRKLFLLCAILFAAISADAQLVKLSRLERAGGKDYIPFTDANGKQSYQLLQNILDTMVQVGGNGGGDVFGNGAYGLDAMWVNDSTIWRGHTYWDSIGRTLEFYPNDTYDNWMVSMDSTNKTIYFDPDHDATSEFQIATNTAGFFEFTGSPVLSNSSGLYWYTFNGDSNTGIRRQSGDVLNFQAGDATNPMLQLDGPGDFVNIDANDDATKEVIFGATTADFISEVRINTPSTDNTTHLAGLDAGEDITKLAFDSTYFSITSGASVDTLTFTGSSSLATPHLFFGMDNIGSYQAHILTGPATYDTLQIGASHYEFDGVTYAAPNPSADSAIIFGTAGTYQVHFVFDGELTNATTNQRLLVKWIKNGTSTVTGTTFSWGFEGAEYTNHSQVFILTVSANDWIQIVAKPAVNGSGTLRMLTPKVSVIKLSD